MSEKTDRDHVSVRGLLMLEPHMVNGYLVRMSDDALHLAKDLLIAESNRRFTLKHKGQEKRDATQEGQQP